MSSSKGPADIKYDEVIIPMGWVIANYPDAKWVKDAAGVSLVDVTKGTGAGFQAAMQFLVAMWGLQHPGWQAVKTKCRISILKETPDCGNTSVSMGVAGRYFGINPTAKRVLLLNCGTGGIKYQEGVNNNGLVIIGREFKPSQRVGEFKVESKSPTASSSPQGICQGSYKPKDVTTLNDAIKQLDAELAQLELGDDCTIIAFITGTVRAHWEQADPAEKRHMDNIMTLLFRDARIRPFSESFFMPQRVEAELEYQATSMMHKNAHRAGHLPNEPTIIASFGIGRGSTQFASPSFPEPFTHPLGMDTPTNLDTTLHAECIKFFAIAENMNPFVELIKGSDLPVISLKSGAVLEIEKNAPCRAALVARVE